MNLCLKSAAVETPSDTNPKYLEFRTWKLTLCSKTIAKINTTLSQRRCHVRHAMTQNHHQNHFIGHVHVKTSLKETVP